MTIFVKCPNCQKQVSWIKDSVSRPFCSERCKLIDLGDWANEKRTILGSNCDWQTIGDNKKQ